MQSTRSSATSDSTPAATAQTPAGATSAPAQAKAAALSPDAALRSAFSLGEIKSAKFEGSFSISAKGDQQGKAEVSGRFQRGGPDDLPKLDVQIHSDGFGSKFDVGFVSTGDKAYIVSDDTGYQLPDAAWSQAAQARATQTGAAATPALPSFDPTHWVKSAKVEGSEQLDGVETQHVSATLDTAAALRELGQLGTGADLDAQAAKQIDRAELDVWVGSDDKLLRRVDVALAGQGVEMNFQARLSEVNDPQTIDAPDKVSDALPANVLGGATSAFSSGLSFATGADPQSIELPTNNNPQRLARAVKDHRKALILFKQPRGLDDQATAEAVRAADRQTKALVLSDDVRNTKRYGKLVEDVGVTQAPAIVIVDRDGKAHLIEGYVDAGTLVQELSDAR
ncbi:MAG TPA: hypothetical protein VI111_06010 [Thermoleophilaceae bacterium]